MLSIDSRIALFHSATPPQTTHLRAVVAATAQFAWQAAKSEVLATASKNRRIKETLAAWWENENLYPKTNVPNTITYYNIPKLHPI